MHRIIAGAKSHFHPLKEVLMDTFLLKLTTLNLTSEEMHLMCKSVRHLGIGIVDPVFEAPLAFDSSQEAALAFDSSQECLLIVMSMRKQAMTNVKERG